MFANAAQLASQTRPGGALIAYGTKLLGIPYSAGMPATTTVTFTVEDDIGYTIPAGSQLAIDGFAFDVTNDVEYAPAGATEQSALVTAAENSSSYNALAGASVVGVSLPAFVIDIAVDAPTGGGVDPQTPEDYAGDLSTELQLTSRAIITLPDFERAAQALPGIERAYAQTDGARNVTVTLLGDGGTIVSDDLKDQLAAIYQANRLVNIRRQAHGGSRPSTKINVTLGGGRGHRGSTAAGDLTVPRINATLADALSPSACTSLSRPATPSSAPASPTGPTIQSSAR